MKSRRAFSPDDIPRKKDDYHGGGTFTQATPDLASQGVKSLNLEIPFDQALRISLAIQSCLQAVNRYKRSTTKGQSMGLLLSIKLDNSTVSIIEAPIAKQSTAQPSKREPRRLTTA